MQFSVSSGLVVAAMCDCAKSRLPSYLGCWMFFPHTRVGKHFKFPLVNEFTTYLISLFSHSFKACLLWKEIKERSVCVCGYSEIRWWSKWKVMNQLLELSGDVDFGTFFKKF